MPGSFIFTTALHRNRVCTNYSNIRKVRAFLRPAHYGQNDITRIQTVTCGDIRIALYPEDFLEPSQTGYREIYHSKAALKRIIKLLASFSVCEILGAKSGCFPDSQWWTSLSTSRATMKRAVGLVVVASERH